MPETASKMLPLGTKAASFELIDMRTEKPVSLESIDSPKGTVIMFLSNHCPYVKHIQPKLVEVTNYYQSQGIIFFAICSNDVEMYPADGPDKMREEAVNAGYQFPYLYDPTQQVAKAYQAACTPDFYIFDQEMLCVYRGCFDESTPGNNKPVTGSHLTKALDNLLAGSPIDSNQIPSLGCNIKWK